MVLLGVVCVHSLTAHGAPRAAQSQRVALGAAEVQLIQLTAGEDGSDAERQRLSRRLDRGIRSVSPPPALVEALRWSPRAETARACTQALEAAGTLAGVSRSSQPLPDDLFKTLLEQADRQLLDLQFDATLERVRQATALVPCLTRVVETSQVRALFLYEAVVRFYQKDKQYALYFQHMLGADSRLFLETDFPPKVQQAFLAVAKKVSRLPSLPLALEGLEGTAYLDGRRADAVTSLAPGRHLLQQVGPGGEVLSRFVEVSGGSSDAPGGVLELARLTEALPSAEASLEHLAEALQEERLALELREALERYAEAEQRSLLGFLVTTSSGELDARFFAAGKGIVSPSPAELKVLEVSRAALPEPVPTAPDMETARASQPESQPGPELGLRVSFGSGLRLLLTRPDVRVVETPQLPALVTALVPMGRLELRVEADLNLLMGSAPAEDCGDYTGASEPSSAEVDAALSCMPGGLALQAGAGAGLTLRLNAQLYLSPAVTLNATLLPRVLLQEGDAASWAVHRVLSVGPTLSGRILWVVPLGGPGPGVGLYLEPSVGLRLAPLGSGMLTGLSASGTLGGEVVF